MVGVEVRGGVYKMRYSSPQSQEIAPSHRLEARYRSWNKVYRSNGVDDNPLNLTSSLSHSCDEVLCSTKHVASIASIDIEHYEKKKSCVMHLCVHALWPIAPA